MGYCYMTGKKVNGRWKFLKCDGRSDKCAQDGSSPPPMTALPDTQCKDCVEWCSTWTGAKEALENWYKQHPEEVMPK